MYEDFNSSLWNLNEVEGIVPCFVCKSGGMLWDTCITCNTSLGWVRISDLEPLHNNLVGDLYT